MIIYQADKTRFLHDVRHRDIEEVILESFKARTGHAVAHEEIRSWANSLGYMGKVLGDPGIPDDCGVAVEYTIPQTAKRVDFLLTGKTETHNLCLVIVELKQWNTSEATGKDAVVRTRLSRGTVEVSHPSYQAWSYAALLEGFNEAVYEGGISLKPCAYLHNYPAPGSPLSDPFYSEHIERAPLFLKGEAERGRLQAFIRKHVRYGDKAETLFRIEGGRIRPSKSLADALAGLMKGNQEFVLIDDQKLVYEAALAHARKVRDQGKRVLIVEGGPGTGKSVIAVNLLAGLTKAGMVAKYVTKNRAPRQVYEARLVGHMRRTQFSNLFAGSGAFLDAGENAFDALVVDEAHRLNEKSGLYENLGEHQVKEIIRAARFSVFFVDEAQKVTLKDVGDNDVIRKWAKTLGAKVEETSLASQFRCNGSDGYLAWLDNTLQIAPTANDVLDVAGFDFRIVDSPNELRNLIIERNVERNRARLVAGYCWPWNSRNDPGAHDIELPEHQFRARWNLAADEGRWIMSETSVNEVGCIHTCQGLEVDYVGVIIGDDFVVRGGKVVTRPEKRAGSDRSIRGWKKLARTDPEAVHARVDAIIKNTYRTLMTRGMRGCYVYFTDKETADHFRTRLTGSRAPHATVWPPAAASQHVEVPSVSSAVPLPVLTRKQARSNPRAVPLIPLKIAAGGFSDIQTIDACAEQWVELPHGFSPGPELFVAQVVGESMNRKIPNGSWCLFRAFPKGSRNGKIVLVQHHDITDPDTGGTYTVKQYTSEKRADGEDWTHARIVLAPLSSDARYTPIVLMPGEADEVSVIAELVAIF